MNICSAPRFLITTADERSWRPDRPVLFLGEWCRLYKRRASWERLDAQVVPYHWDDREQLYRDYLYLRDLYESLLSELAEALNAYHGVAHSQRYWRLLVGPWLGYFTQILFDRWTMIHRAAAGYQIDGTLVLEVPPEEAIPAHMGDFAEKFANDTWNHHICGRILTGWTDIRCERGGIADADRTPPVWYNEAATLHVGRRVRRMGARFLSLLSAVVSRKTDAFFLATYLPLLQDFSLQAALGQIPKLWRTLPPPRVAPDLSARRRLSLRENGAGKFEQCLRRLIPEQIPTLYLEGYRVLQTTAADLPWPRRPKLIYTSNSYNVNDIFKAWAAARVDEGSPLVIGQHGGTCGASRWNFIEEHEQAIADRCLTWGWSENPAKHYPTCALKLQGERTGRWNPQGGILLATMVAPRYSYWMYSGMIAGQTLGYLEDQFRFAASLPDSLRAQLLVRLYVHDMGWGQMARWRDRLPDVRLASTRSSFLRQARHSRIVVATYNSTTFLETLGLDIPTVIFWNPRHWELRLSAQPYFARLKEVGILHDTPESAARQIATVWEDVRGWWHRTEVQEARRIFCDHFARMPRDYMKVLTEALTTIDRAAQVGHLAS